MNPRMFWFLNSLRGRGPQHEDQVYAGDAAGHCAPGGHGGHGEGHRHGHGPGRHGFGRHFRGEWPAPPPWLFNEGDAGGFGPSGGFGVRRPLRFLAWKLDLDEAQVAEIARVLDDMKTERAQAAVDQRRTAAALADALTGDAFDAAKAAEAAAPRVQSAERLRAATVRALERIHKVLRPEQRAALATMVRTGAVQL